ncbi:hypothetical protein SELMODRAFT_178917 [Selaginella moellendorffii]|uniref:NADH:flavin oxidoreductase/NADH oxidase N-terminal domain-containing protein n=1 Tax=Selaginella moellendorffii TaxID=88036 RepID=D8SDW2_SELML|nr:putative 12-oxophytodienoate reductase-like protein 2A [Selaginella moellendorffii]EFJ17318.1 hypothetical protein SELMODRAFT_178917 [Selaginella moellendorffii]|eukprot:XP_002981503.1 putative 12-oxophytodienoate reductase-like protein 2A [Selaginella moellendorffii]
MAPPYKRLLEPVLVGDSQLQHRVAMSPMTRLRNHPDLEAPGDLNVLYYSQRSSNGGLIISEGTYPTPDSRGYIRMPGIWSPEQIKAWKRVTDAVHAKGGVIFCQLMPAGRISHSSLLPDGMLPVAPSAVKPSGLVHVREGKVPYEVPRALELEEIPAEVDKVAAAATRAIEAGFDGIELHSGNGYLMQQFLAKETNLRTDEYGGSVENRARFVLEVVDACAKAIGSHRVGIKLQQGVTFSGLVEPEDDSLDQLAYLGPELEKRDLAYVCMSSLNYDPYYKFLGLDKPNFETDVFQFFRKHFKGTLMINGGIQPQKAEEYVEEGTCDLVCFAVLFIANANLPQLLAAGQELNMGGWTTSTWYSRDPMDDPKGYTDWPLVEAAL